MIKIVPILLGVVGSYIVAAIFGQVDFSAVASAKWVGFPIQMDNTVFSLFKSCDGGRLVSAIAIMMPIALATMVEHIGDVCAISSTVGENFVADPGLHRTLLGDGCATSLAVLFAFCPKFEALIHAMPDATIGGVSLILYGMISAVGVRNVVENQVDFTKSRNIIVAAMILGLTLGIHFSGSQGADTVNAINGAISFSIGAVTIKLSGLAVGALAGILLNAILPGNDYEFGTNQLGDTSVNFQQGIDRAGTKKRK